MHHLFISYSRRDRQFVERLSSALVSQGRTTWVDWQDIPPTAKFMEEIRNAIDASDSFLFVISPDSCHSPVCRQELAHAAAGNKRLIPIVCRPTPDADVPSEVAPINWIVFSGDGTFDEALARLTAAIDTDLAWVHAHTELLVRAKEWDQLGRPRSALLRGGELTTAEQNLVSEAGKAPLVVPLQQEFVVASRRNATRTLRIIVGAVSAALIVTVALAVLATQQRRAAELQRDRAEDTARLMIAQSLAATDPTSAALVLLELHDPLGRGLEAVPAFRHVAEQPIASAVLRGHSGFVFAGAFSPDGQHVVTASGDRTARIWRTDGLGKPIVLRGHDGTVRSASFSADGRRVITVSEDRTARIWPADGVGAPIVLRDHGTTVSFAKFSGDGSRVVTASDDIRLWSSNGALLTVVRPPDAVTIIRDAAFAGEQLRVVGIAKNDALVWTAGEATPAVMLRGHTQAINSARFSSDGSRVVTASNDGTVRLWQVDGGDPIVFRGGRAFGSATVSGDGSHVAATDGSSIFAWSAANADQPVIRRSPEFVMSLTLSFDGKRMATFADAKNFHLARVWRTEGPDESIVLAGHEGHVYSTAFSRDGTKILTTGTDGTARVWPAAGSREPLVLGNRDVWINDARFNRSSTRVVTASDDKTARVWPLTGTDPPVVLAGHAQRVATAAFSPDGRRIVTASDDGTARLWTLGDSTPPIVLDGRQGPLRWATFTSAGNTVVSAAADRAWQIWSLAAPATARMIAPDEPGAQWISLSPDGSHALAASDRSPLRLVSLDGGGSVVFSNRTGAGKTVFSGDGTRIAIVSPGTTIQVWNAANGRAVATLEGQSSPVVTASFSPDARRLVTSSGDRIARIWQIDSNGPPMLLRGHADAVWDASFSPDGTLVLTSAEDGTVRIWNSDGRDEPLVLTLPSDQNIVMHAAFSPDGSRVLTRTFTTSHRPNDVRVFRVDVGSLLAFLRDSTSACLTPEVRARALAERGAVAKSRFEACEAAKIGR